MVLSQRSLQSPAKKPSAIRTSFSLTGKIDKVLSSLKSMTKTAPGHKSKDAARSISLFPDVFLTKANTEDSPTRLPAGSWDGFFTTDRDTRIVMPYLQFSKEKRLYHSPFVWNFDENLAKHINSNSLFVIRETSADAANCYQIQPNNEKIERLREQIIILFQMYYKLVFYSKIRINCSLEINKLKQLLQDIGLKIDAERSYDYENGAQDLFTSLNIHQEIFEQYKQILELPIKEKFIPKLAKLKKEFYAMEYLSEQHSALIETLDSLIEDINRTIGISYILKKQVDAGNKLTSLSPIDVDNFQKARTPQDLYDSFITVSAQIKALSNEANMFSKLRTSYRTYLKILVILEVYIKGEGKLKDLKKRLLVINNRLQKKAEAQNADFYDLFRRATSDAQTVELPVEECGFDLKKLIEGEEESLDKAKTTAMQQHIINVEAFVRRAELFCEELAVNRNPKKVIKMQENSALCIQQVEMVLRALTFAKQKMEEIKPLVENESLEEPTVEAVEKQMRLETRDIAYQIKQYNNASDLESWSSSKVTTALKTSIQHDSMLKKYQKGNQKGIAFGKKQTIQKLAKIIRNRTHEKNKVYVSCKNRVESALTIGDVLNLFKSKRLWQSIGSPKAYMISIQSWSPDLKKLIQRKVYCNPELESYILRTLRAFVNSLAETPMKCLPSN